MVQCLGLCTATVGGTGLIPGWGTRIPHAALHSQKKERKKESHHQTQNPLDLILCYFLGVLQLCVLHLGLWSIWANFCERCVCLDVVFFSFLRICKSSSFITICWKDHLFFIELSLLFCQRSVDYNYVGLFLGSLFCSIDLFVYSFTSTTQSWLL